METSFSDDRAPFRRVAEDAAELEAAAARLADRVAQTLDATAALPARQAQRCLAEVRHLFEVRAQLNRGSGPEPEHRLHDTAGPASHVG